MVAPYIVDLVDKISTHTYTRIKCTFLYISANTHIHPAKHFRNKIEDIFILFDYTNVLLIILFPSPLCTFALLFKNFILCIFLIRRNTTESSRRRRLNAKVTHFWVIIPLAQRVLQPLPHPVRLYIVCSINEFFHL